MKPIVQRVFDELGSGNLNLLRVNSVDTARKRAMANTVATVVLSECPFNCLTCADTGDGVPTMRCKTCNYQYVLNEGDCGACPRYCLKCSESKNGLTCIQCQNKTVMMSDGTCERKFDRELLLPASLEKVK